jgi:hypothetical protein
MYKNQGDMQDEKFQNCHHFYCIRRRKMLHWQVVFLVLNDLLKQKGIAQPAEGGDE